MKYCYYCAAVSKDPEGNWVFTNPEGEKVAEGDVGAEHPECKKFVDLHARNVVLQRVTGA